MSTEHEVAGGGVDAAESGAVEMIGIRLRGAIEPSVVASIREKLYGNKGSVLRVPMLGVVVTGWAHDLELIEASAAVIRLALKGMDTDGCDELASVVLNGILNPVYELVQRISVAVNDSRELST